MSCYFNICSLITDVRDSVGEIPRDPEQVKTLLFEHLGSITKPHNENSHHTSVITPTTIFKHPISYTNPDKLHELPTSIIEDLEMLEVKPKHSDSSEKQQEHDMTIDNNVKGLYHYILFSEIRLWNRTFAHLEQVLYIRHRILKTNPNVARNV